VLGAGGDGGNCTRGGIGIKGFVFLFFFGIIELRM
jgi:hypothetical protein